MAELTANAGTTAAAGLAAAERVVQTSGTLLRLQTARPAGEDLRAESTADTAGRAPAAAAEKTFVFIQHYRSLDLPYSSRYTGL